MLYTVAFGVGMADMDPSCNQLVRVFLGCRASI